MIKKCTKCKKIKPEDEFHWKSKIHGKRCSCCRVCKQEMQKKYYENNKDAYLSKIMETRKARKSIAWQNTKQYLECHPCIDCGESDIRKLEFDHVRGEKLLGVCQMVQEGYGWTVVEKEISKCEVRCSNCHKVKTWPNRWGEKS